MRVEILSGEREGSRAICHAKWTDKKLEITTIQGEAPVGICGTGVIELVAELVKAMEVDETGRLEEPWFSKGYPVAHTKRGKRNPPVPEGYKGNTVGKSGSAGRDRNFTGRIPDYCKGCGKSLRGRRFRVSAGL